MEVLESDRREGTDAITYVDAAIDPALVKGTAADMNLSRAQALERAIGGRYDPDHTVHFKGFASGLTAMTQEQLQKDPIVFALKSRLHGVDTIVWDGDDFDESSFTAVLPCLQQELPHLHFAAFLMMSERFSRYGNPSGFEGSWKGRLRNLNVYLIDDEVAAGDQYEQLGVIALRATKATSVFAIGGGMVLRREFDQLQSLGVQYTAFDAVRRRDGAETPCALIGLGQVELIEITGGWAPIVRSGKRQRPVMLAATLMNLVAISEAEQTCKMLLYMRMQWETRSTDPEDWEPHLEWRDVDQMDEKLDYFYTMGEYKCKCWSVKVVVYQPLDLEAFPFDSHRLVLEIVADSTCEMIVTTLGDYPASLHPRGNAMLYHSQWKVLHERDEKGVIRLGLSTDPTVASDSKSQIQYGRFVVSLCVTRRWQYMAWNMMLPLWLIGSSALMRYSTADPIQTQDRLAIDFALFLTVIALKMVAVTLLPKVPYLTFLDVYYLLTYIFIVLIAAETCLRPYLVHATFNASVWAQPSLDGTVDEEQALDRAHRHYDAIAFFTAAGTSILYNVGYAAMAWRKHGIEKEKSMRWLLDNRARPQSDE